MLINVELMRKGFMEQNQHDHKDSICNYQPKIIIESIIGSIYRNKDDAENQTRLDKIDVSFKKAGELRFVPHAALIDLESGSLDIDVIKASPSGTMFKPDNFVFGVSGAGNNWAEGRCRNI